MVGANRASHRLAPARLAVILPGDSVGILLSRVLARLVSEPTAFVADLAQGMDGLLVQVKDFLQGLPGSYGVCSIHKGSHQFLPSLSSRLLSQEVDGFLIVLNLEV